jgi:hypothetical protein
LVCCGRPNHSRNTFLTPYLGCINTLLVISLQLPNLLQYWMWPNSDHHNSHFPPFLHEPFLVCRTP